MYADRPDARVGTRLLGAGASGLLLLLLWGRCMMHAWRQCAVLRRCERDVLFSGSGACPGDRAAGEAARGRTFPACPFVGAPLPSLTVQSSRVRPARGLHVTHGQRHAWWPSREKHADAAYDDAATQRRYCRMLSRSARLRQGEMHTRRPSASAALRALPGQQHERGVELLRLRDRGDAPCLCSPSRG